MAVQVLLGPGHSASRQLEQSAPQAPNVGLHVVDGVDDRLGGHPMRRALLGLAALGLVVEERQGPFEVLGAPEVAQLDHSFVREQDVGAFQILVHDFVFVEVVQSDYELFGEVEIGFEGRGPEVLVKPFQSARHVFHEDQSLLSQMVVLNVMHNVIM